MSSAEPFEWDPADWDATDADPPDPEDTADHDGPQTHLDDLPDDLAEEIGEDVVPRHVEETVPWQEYNRPVPD